MKKTLLIILLAVVVLAGAILLGGDKSGTSLGIVAGEVFDVSRSARTISLIRINSHLSSLFEVAVVDGTSYRDDAVGGESGFEDIEKGDFVVAVGAGDESSLVADKILFRKNIETGFSKIGNISVDAPGNRSGVPYLLYDTPGAPVNSLGLIFADFSVCDIAGSSGSCDEIKDNPARLSGERVFVYGNREGGSVYVIYLEGVESESDSAMSDEKTLVGWELAKSYIRDCSVEQVTQLHSRDVQLDLKDGRKLVTEEPEIDIVFDIVLEASDECGQIRMVTE